MTYRNLILISFTKKRDSLQRVKAGIQSRCFNDEGHRKVDESEVLRLTERVGILAPG